MVVADDKVDAELRGVGHLLDGLDAAVEGNNQLHPGVAGVVNAFKRNAVPFAVAVGYVKVDVAVESTEVGVHQGNSRCAVHVVISIYQDTLVAANRLIDACNGAVHILHQERVMQLVQAWTEETPCLFIRGNTTLNKQRGDNFVNS